MLISLNKQPLVSKIKITREIIAIAAIMALTAALDLIRLDQEGFGNPYYAAAVKSMLTSWHNAFFLSFDPAGFISLDKPPLGFWLQTLSAMLFRNQTWSLLLPQAIAGIGTVWVVYRTGKLVAGSLAGLLAALFTAVAPVMTAANRNNAVDSLVILACAIASWLLIKAVQSGQLRWLLGCMAMIGLGFNIKMLQAYLILPACAITYLMAAPHKIWRRLYHLALSGVLLAVFSLCWMAAVDLTPAS